MDQKELFYKRVENLVREARRAGLSNEAIVTELEGILDALREEGEGS
jgi:hypothetical protein